MKYDYGLQDGWEDFKEVRWYIKLAMVLAFVAIWAPILAIEYSTQTSDLLHALL